MQNRVRQIGVFAIGCVAGATLLFVGRTLQLYFQPKTTFTPQPITFNLQPPTNALQAQVIDASGDVTKTPLHATQSATLHTGDQVVMGEPIVATDSSKISLQIGSLFQSTASANTLFTLESGIPESALFKQDDGTVTYTTLQNALPLSIRTLHFLLTLTNGQIQVTTDQQLGTAKVQLLSGTAKIAWEDKQLNSQLLNLELKKTFLLDDTTKTVTVSK